MKIAVLILAHKNKGQLERLISVMQHSLVDIYIHLDKKSSLSPADFSHLDVRFTKKRFDVYPFTFSMVEAEMELINTAKKHGEYGYYIILSGQCYPLRHIDDICDYLCQSYPKPFIEVISPKIVKKFAAQFSYSYALKKFRNAYLPFINQHFPASDIIPYRYIPAIIVRTATIIKSVFVKSPQKSLKKMGIEPYFGPQWWILPDVVIDDISTLFENKKFCDCMKNCYCCDETFFQTAIMIHAEKFGIILNEKGYYSNKKWFTIFSKGHPIVLTQENFEQLMCSGMLFGRKFDSDIDAKILDMIDEQNLRMRK